MSCCKNWRAERFTDTANRRQPGVAPELALRARSAQHPVADRNDQAGFLRDLNEVAR
jgi:hypothetical protein